jgi:hypothetical protein
MASTTPSASGSTRIDGTEQRAWTARGNGTGSHKRVRHSGQRDEGTEQRARAARGNGTESHERVRHSGQRDEGTEQRARAMRGNGTGSRKRARHSEHDGGGPRRTVTMNYDGATAETAASRREHLEADSN